MDMLPPDLIEQTYQNILSKLEIRCGPILIVDPSFPQAGGYLSGVITVRPAPAEQLLLTIRHEICHWLQDKATGEPTHDWRFFALRALICKKLGVDYWNAVDDLEDQAAGNFFVAAPLFREELCAARRASRQCFDVLEADAHDKTAAEIAHAVMRYSPTPHPATWLPLVTDRHAARENLAPKAALAAIAISLLIGNIVAGRPQPEVIAALLIPVVVLPALADRLFLHFARLGIAGQRPIISLDC